MTDIIRDETNERASVIEWRGKVAAILEFLAKQIEELNKKFEGVVSKESFNDLKEDFCKLQNQLNNLIVLSKVFETKFASQEGKEAEIKNISNKKWDIIKIIIGALVGAIVALIFDRLIGK